MIGYYAHHVGHGHLRQAQTIAAVTTRQVTILSSLPRPADLVGGWVGLPRDDQTDGPRARTADGLLHWAPLQDDGLRSRMGIIAAWIRDNRPAAMVVDVSVEVTAFARLMGVPVVAIMLPGRRDDPAHRLGYSLAETLIAPWPASFGLALAEGSEDYAAKVRYVGGFSRFDGRAPAPKPAGETRRAIVLQGSGGVGPGAAQIDAARAATPGWRWTVFGVGGRWVEDPWPALSTADVIITHAGLNAVAEVAATRRPAIVIAQPRPHDEQLATAAALGRAGLAITLGRWPAAAEWPNLLDRALRFGQRL